jgi:hypothetical protein
MQVTQRVYLCIAYVYLINPDDYAIEHFQCSASGEEAAIGWMSLVNVLFSCMFRILRTGTLNLRELIFDYGKNSH